MAGLWEAAPPDGAIRLGPLPTEQGWRGGPGAPPAPGSAIPPLLGPLPHHGGREGLGRVRAAAGPTPSMTDMLASLGTG